MWKAIFQSKLSIYKANLPSFVHKKSLLCGLIAQTSAEMPPKNGGVRKANWPAQIGYLYHTEMI
jgi:hypothetical protein